MKISLFQNASSYLRKNLSKIQNKTPQIPQSINKTPEISSDMFVHLTNAKSWEKIQKEGLKVKNDYPSGLGVCFVQPKNYASWQEVLEPDRKHNMLQALFNRVNRDNTVVAIGINPSEFDSDKFIIRSQDDFVQYKSSKLWKDSDKLARDIAEKYKSKKMKSKVYLKVLQLCLWLKNPNLARAVIKGEPMDAIKRTNKAFEEIYRGNIPASLLTKIGEVSIKEVQKSPNYDATKPIQNYFSELFKNTPFEEDMKKIKC